MFRKKKSAPRHSWGPCDWSAGVHHSVLHEWSTRNYGLWSLAPLVCATFQDGRKKEIENVRKKEIKKERTKENKNTRTSRDIPSSHHSCVSRNLSKCHFLDLKKARKKGRKKERLLKKERKKERKKESKNKGKTEKMHTSTSWESTTDLCTHELERPVVLTIHGGLSTFQEFVYWVLKCLFQVSCFLSFFLSLSLIWVSSPDLMWKMFINNRKS